MNVYYDNCDMKLNIRLDIVVKYAASIHFVINASTACISLNIVEIEMVYSNDHTLSVFN